MSKREHLLIWSVALLVGFFALDRLGITPLQNRLNLLHVDAVVVEQQINEDRVLVDNRELIETRWAGRVNAGLGQGPAAARLRVQGQLSDFAESAGLTLTNLSAGGNLNSAPFTEVRFSLTATGDLRSVVRFIEQVQETSTPLAVLTCGISHRDGRGNRLTLRMTVSTFVFAGKEAAP